MQKTCTLSCRTAHERNQSRKHNRDYNQRQRSGVVVEQLDRTCVLCGGGFTTNQREKQTCHSPACMSMWKLRQVRRLADRGGEVLRVTEKDLRRLLARHRARCAYCAVAVTRVQGPACLEWDHVIPISRGGRHSIGNLLPTCRACNRGKEADLLVVWRAYLRGRAAWSDLRKA
jgi:predicted restriction endonuclease